MINFTIQYTAPIGRKLRGFKAKLKELFQAAIIFWHGNFLQHHFDTPAKVNARYPGIFRPRTRRHMIRKAKVLGHQRVLDWSGTTRAEMLRSIRVSGTSSGARGTMTGSNRALNFGGRAGMPNMRDEITAVNQAEADVMAASVDRGLTEYLNSEDDGGASVGSSEGASVPPGRQIVTGRRGGRYYKNDAGRRVYLKRG